MPFLTKMLALTRLLILSRQIKEIRRLIDDIPRGTRRQLGAILNLEMQKAAQHPQPHLYGSQRIDRYAPWGDAAELALDRARSELEQLRLRGIATWITVVFHETEDSNHAGLQAIHREVLGFMGELRGTFARAAAQRAAEAAA
jgi:hypothetical protein